MAYLHQQQFKVIAFGVTLIGQTPAGIGAEICQPGGHALGGHGAGDGVALHHIAAQFQQHQDMFDAFHPFGHHLVTECLGQADHPLNNAHIAGIIEHVAHKAAVDLHLVDRQLLEVHQAGVAGTEVIQRELHAVGLEAGKELAHRLHILQCGGLHQFDHQQAGRSGLL